MLPGALYGLFRAISGFLREMLRCCVGATQSSPAPLSGFVRFTRAIHPADTLRTRAGRVSVFVRVARAMLRVCCAMGEEKIVAASTIADATFQG